MKIEDVLARRRQELQGETKNIDEVSNTIKKSNRIEDVLARRRQELTQNPETDVKPTKTLESLVKAEPPIKTNTPVRMKMSDLSTFDRVSLNVFTTTEKALSSTAMGLSDTANRASALLDETVMGVSDLATLKGTDQLAGAGLTAVKAGVDFFDTISKLGASTIQAYIDTDFATPKRLTGDYDWANFKNAFDVNYKRFDENSNLKSASEYLGKKINSLEGYKSYSNERLNNVNFVEKYIDEWDVAATKRMEKMQTKLSEKFEYGFADEIYKAIPQLAVFVGTSVLTKASASSALSKFTNDKEKVENISSGITNFVSSATEASMESKEVERELIEQGVDPETARSKAEEVFNNNLGLLVVANKLSGIFDENVYTGFKRLLTYGLVGGSEGSQEVLQQMFSNIAMDKPILDGDLSTQALVGFIIGSSAKIGFDVLSSLPNKEKGNTNEEIDNAIDNLNIEESVDFTDNLVNTTKAESIEIDDTETPQKATIDNETKQAVQNKKEIVKKILKDEATEEEIKDVVIQSVIEAGKTPIDIDIDPNGMYNSKGESKFTPELTEKVKTVRQQAVDDIVRFLDEGNDPAIVYEYLTTISKLSDKKATSIISEAQLKRDLVKNSDIIDNNEKPIDTNTPEVARRGSDVGGGALPESNTNDSKGSEEVRQSDTGDNTGDATIQNEEIDIRQENKGKDNISTQSDRKGSELSIREKAEKEYEYYQNQFYPPIERKMSKEEFYSRKMSTDFLEKAKKRYNIDFDILLTDKILSFENPDINILGLKTYNDEIILKRDGLFTVPHHEFIHLVLANLNTIKAFRDAGFDRKELFEEMRKYFGADGESMSDLDLEEHIAMTFEDYIRNKTMIENDLIERFMEWLHYQLKAIKRLLDVYEGNLLLDFYDTVYYSKVKNKETARLTNKYMRSIYTINSKGHFFIGPKHLVPDSFYKLDSMMTKIAENEALITSLNDIVSKYKVGVNDVIDNARTEIENYVAIYEEIQKFNELEQLYEGLYKFLDLKQKTSNLEDRVEVLTQKVEGLVKKVKSKKELAQMVEDVSLETLTNDIPLETPETPKPIDRSVGKKRFAERFNANNYINGIQFDTDYEKKTFAVELAKSLDFIKANEDIIDKYIKQEKNLPDNIDINNTVLKYAILKYTEQKGDNSLIKYAFDSFSDLTVSSGQNISFINQVYKMFANSDSMIYYMDKANKLIDQGIIKKAKKLKIPDISSNPTKTEIKKIKKEIVVKKSKESKYIDLKSQLRDTKSKSLDDFFTLIKC